MANVFPGIGVSGYRSFGPDMEFIGPLGKMSVVISPNNSGKSTLLSIFSLNLTKVWQLIQASSNTKLEGYERIVRGEPPASLEIAWPVSPDLIEVPNDPPVIRKFTD